MESRVLKIVNKMGFHARPATDLVSCAKAFESSVKIKKIATGKIANAKSILNVLALSCCFEDEIELLVEGVDEKTAIDTLVEKIQNGLTE